MADGVRTTTLRDYYAGRRVVALADWEGSADSKPGLFYRLGGRVLQANNDLIAAITGLPGQFRDNFAILSDPTQRKNLARALVDDEFLTARRRKAIFSILLWSTLFIYAAVAAVLYITNRGALPAYQSAYSLFFYSIATSLFLPTPFEVLLTKAAADIGNVATVAIAAFAKTVGSWLVLLMGDKANAGLNAVLEKRRFLKRIFDALQRFAQKFGYAAVFIMFAIPFMSDTAPLFILAVLHMKKLPFLVVTFVAIVVRSVLYLWLF